MHAQHREALRKPNTKGTSERSERESYSSGGVAKGISKRVIAIGQTRQRQGAIKKYSNNNPSIDCETLGKPNTKGTSERSERASY
jgi:hypothetical protein